MIRAYYRYDQRPDPQSTQTKSGLTLLQIGKHANKFGDYNQLQSDSLCDAMTLQKVSLMEQMNRLSGLVDKQVFKPLIVIDRAQQQMTVQETIVFRHRYEYTEAVPEIEWQMAEGERASE